MIELLTKQHKHQIWHDELGESFLLLKYAEVFEYSETALGLHCWSKKMLAVMRFEGLISFEMETDDPLYILRVDKCHLPRLLALGSFRKRPDINGAWIQEKEKLLAHRIFTYRPKEVADDEATLKRVDTPGVNKENGWAKHNEKQKERVKQWLSKQKVNQKGETNYA